MLHSMTGFGRGVSRMVPFSAQAELRSVNSRFLEIRLRGLADLPQLVQRCEAVLRERFSRGTLELSVRWEKDGVSRPKRLNVEAARSYQTSLRELTELLGASDGPQLGHLISLGVFEDEVPEPEALWSSLSLAVQGACDELAEARAAEGERLVAVLRRELETIDRLLREARRLAGEDGQGWEARVRERLQRLDVDADPGRLEVELALLAERGDVQEELDRIGSHMTRLADLLEGEGPVGRELEFLAQELGREANTVGAKARAEGLSRVAMDLRLTAERIREQARNVE